MKSKYLLIIACLMVLSNFAFSQEFAADKGAVLFAGTGSFISSGDDLFEDGDGNRATTFSLTPTFNYFVAKNIFVGGGMEFISSTQGDWGNNSFGIGPQIGYMFGNQESTVFPYIDAGLRLQSMKYKYKSLDDEKATGTDIFFSAGMIVPLKSHIGLVFEAGYHVMNLKQKETKHPGNIFAISIGIAGLLF